MFVKLGTTSRLVAAYCRNLFMITLVWNKWKRLTKVIILNIVIPVNTVLWAFFVDPWEVITLWWAMFFIRELLVCSFLFFSLKHFLCTIVLSLHRSFVHVNMPFLWDQLLMLICYTLPLGAFLDSWILPWCIVFTKFSTL